MLFCQLFCSLSQNEPGRQDAPFLHWVTYFQTFSSIAKHHDVHFTLPKWQFTPYVTSAHIANLALNVLAFYTKTLFQ